jgi:hypothetical protein
MQQLLTSPNSILFFSGFVSGVVLTPFASILLAFVPFLMPDRYDSL